MVFVRIPGNSSLSNIHLQLWFILYCKMVILQSNLFKWRIFFFFLCLFSLFLFVWKQINIFIDTADVNEIWHSNWLNVPSIKYLINNPEDVSIWDNNHHGLTMKNDPKNIKQKSFISNSNFLFTVPHFCFHSIFFFRLYFCNLKGGKVITCIIHQLYHRSKSVQLCVRF